MYRGICAAGAFAAAKAFDGPDGFNAGFWRCDFRNRAFPLGANLVAIVTGAINAFFGELWRRHRRIFRELPVFREQSVDLFVDFLFCFGVEEFFAAQKLFVQRDGITALPVGAHLLGHVFGGIMLRVTHAAEAFCLDQDRAFARARAVDRFLRRAIHGDDVVAVYDVAADSVGFGAVGEIFDGHLFLHRRGVGPQI